MGEVRLRIIKGIEKHERLVEKQRPKGKGEGGEAVTEITCMHAVLQ